MVAVIIPYYKIDFFRDTLNSLASQTDQRFHVYIGDDNSPDNPNELLEEFKNHFSFSYHKFNENLGGISLVKQWERCLTLAKKEDWVIILGDDDVLDKNVIQNFYLQMDEINNLNVDVVRFSTIVIDENNNKISNIYTHPKIEKAVDSLMNKIKGLTRSSLSEYIFRQNKFSNYSLKDFPSALFSDDILILEHSSFKDIFTINSSVIQIRKSNVNLSGGAKIPNRYKAILEFYKTLLFDFNQKFNKEQIQQIEDKLEREIFNHQKLEVIIFMIKYYLKRCKFLNLIKLLSIVAIKLPKFFYLKLNNRI